jgi:CheY-like chemotaxis protein
MDDQSMDKKVNILVVDDEALIRDNLASLLERSGFKVTVAVDGQDALNKLNHAGVDLIVLDVMMPRMDGREALRYA